MDKTDSWFVGSFFLVWKIGVRVHEKIIIFDLLEEKKKAMQLPTLKEMHFSLGRNKSA